MGALFSYSLAASFIAMLLYPVLYQIVNRSTSFRFNRAVLLCGMIFPLLLPGITVLVTSLISAGDAAEATGVVSIIDVDSNNVLNEPPFQNAGENSVSWVAVAIIIYLCGVIALSCREILSYIRLFRLIVSCRKVDVGQSTVCLLDNPVIAPFSWGKYIFLHDPELDDSCKSIFLHEKAHTEKHHWVDVMIAGFYCILLWYNPFAWLTRQLVKLNHEFDADSAVIDSGVDTYAYQRLLVTKAMGTKALSLTNSFAAGRRNFRKRVLMMNKPRSSGRIMLIALCALPATFMAIQAITFPAAAALLSGISDFRFGHELTEEDIAGKVSRKNSVGSVDEAAVSAEDALEAQIDASVRLDSPLRNQKALAEIVKQSLESINPDKETKVNIEVVVDESGQIQDVLSETPDGDLLASVIDRNLKDVRFEPTLDNGKPITMHFRIPVHLKKNESVSSRNSSGAQATEKVVIPEFAGGISALNAFIIENIRSPRLNPEDKKPKNRQTVNVHFTVEADGSVSNAKVPVPVGKEFDEEAIRVVSLTSGKWTPAVQNGDPVSCSLSIPITFSNQ